ncbi:aldehyde ferredoxin oxidoreductase family protein, partial [Candidatus Dojkabacteria bacterium]|nr:aldehyde ferredoxin oxidoreductase family protein [Candidatus Dojkabacteria bacterium]
LFRTMYIFLGLQYINISWLLFNKSIKVKEDFCMKGVFGRYADVNLTTGDISDFEIPQDWYKKFLGGRGIGLRILLQELEGNEDPLGPENIIIFATGPLQGTGIAGAGRQAVITKSPKTGSLSDSYAGGFWGNELANSGYDGIIIRGKATNPVYLTLLNGKVTIQSAENLWGLDVGETDYRLKEKYKGSRILCIGPAGEHLVKFACIINDITRAAGRPGFGAVMGSKNLKAIVIKGGIKKEFYDVEMLKEIKKNLTQELMANSGIKEFGKWGSSAAVSVLNDEGILPTKNFQEGVFDEAEKIDGAGSLFKKILVGRDTCAGCPIRCKRVVRGNYKGKEIKEIYGGPEYETLAALGSNCLNSDVLSISLANQLCNQYGLDTISTGVTIAFAMEASEKGLIKESIKWGDPDAVVNLTESIAFRKGLGDMLAEGIDTIASKIKADFAMHIKGQELPMHDPRGKKALGLSYATTPRGAQHMEAMHDDGAEGLGKYGTPEIGVYGPIDRMSWDNKPRFLKIYQDLGSFANSAIACTYVGWDAALCSGYNPYPRFREALYAATGLEIGVPEMLLIGERNFNMLKLAAAQQGYTRKDDDLPERLKEALPRGNSAGDPIPDDILQSVIDEYYMLRGWDEYGPTDQKLAQLDMKEFVGFIKRE